MPKLTKYRLLDPEMGDDMIRILAGTLVVVTTALLIACGSEEPASAPLTNLSERVDTNAVMVAENTFGPDVTLDGNGPWEIWAMVNAADDRGISIQNVRENDVVTIENIAGVAYFAGHSGWWRVLSTIYAVSGALVTTTSPAAGVITALEKQTAAANNGGDGKDDTDEPASKPRDGYGRDMNGEYAEKEGGLAICLPAAHGPMYANDGNQLTSQAKEYGRFDDLMKPDSDMKDKCFFPTRVTRTPIPRATSGNPGTVRPPRRRRPGPSAPSAPRRGEEQTLPDELQSVMKKDAGANGTLYIYAFDRNYRDNAGGYEIKLRITRGT